MIVALIVEGDSDEIIFNALRNWFETYNINLVVVPTYGINKMIKKSRKHYKACKYFHNAKYVIFMPDLNSYNCPIFLMNEIELDNYNDAILNVMVKELEAWILADEGCINNSIPIGSNYHTSGFTDDINNPKVKLFNIVKKKLKFWPTEIEAANLFASNFSIERAENHNNSVIRFHNIIKNINNGNAL